MEPSGKGVSSTDARWNTQLFISPQIASRDVQCPLARIDAVECVDPGRDETGPTAASATHVEANGIFRQDPPREQIEIPAEQRMQLVLVDRRLVKGLPFLPETLDGLFVVIHETPLPCCGFSCNKPLRYTSKNARTALSKE